MLLAGFDWLFIDLEHSTLSVKDAQSIVQTASPQIPCSVRVPSNDELWIKKALDEPGAFSDHLQHLPYYEQLLPYRETIVEKAGQLVATVSKFLVGGLSSVTLGTVNFLFMSFVVLYTMYFFQMDGDKLMRKILSP